MMCYIYDYDFCGVNNKYLNTREWVAEEVELEHGRWGDNS